MKTGFWNKGMEAVTHPVYECGAVGPAAAARLLEASRTDRARHLKNSHVDKKAQIKNRLVSSTHAVDTINTNCLAHFG